MTENTAGISINYGGGNKIGSVGRCMPFFDLKIASDGEVLIKQPPSLLKKAGFTGAEFPHGATRLTKDRGLHRWRDQRSTLRILASKSVEKGQQLLLLCICGSKPAIATA